MDTTPKIATNTSNKVDKDMINLLSLPSKHMHPFPQATDLFPFFPFLACLRIHLYYTIYQPNKTGKIKEFALY